MWHPDRTGHISIKTTHPANVISYGRPTCMILQIHFCYNEMEHTGRSKDITTLNLELSPQASARLSALAQQKGVDLQTLVSTLVEDYLPPVGPPSLNKRLPTHTVDPENDASIALLQSWLDEDYTDDPDEIKQAEAELLEFRRNVNLPRKEAAARLIYPEAE